MHRAIAMAEMAGAPVYIVHLSSEDALNQVPRSARPRSAGLCGDLPAVSVALARRDDESQLLRRCEVGLHAAAAREEESAEAVGRAERRPPAGRLHRPLSLLLCRSEDSRRERLHQNPQRRSGHREPHAADPSPRRERGQNLSESLRRDHLDRARAHFRHVSKEGNHCTRQRRRHRPLGPERRAHHQRQDPQHARRLLDVRRLQSPRQRAPGLLARRTDRRERQISRQGRPRPYLRRTARGGAWQ